MTKRTRRTHSPGFKAKVVLAATEGENTLAELAKFFDMHPHQFMAQKAQLQEGAAAETTPTVGLKLLPTEFGELTPEKSFLYPARPCRS